MDDLCRPFHAACPGEQSKSGHEYVANLTPGFCALQLALGQILFHARFQSTRPLMLQLDYMDITGMGHCCKVLTHLHTYVSTYIHSQRASRIGYCDNPDFVPPYCFFCNSLRCAAYGTFWYGISWTVIPVTGGGQFYQLLLQTEVTSH